MSGMDTLELVSRLQRSDLDHASLDALRIMADRLCSEYPYMPSDQLLIEGRAWLRRSARCRASGSPSAQHREILVLAGWIALLIGCVEYDTGNRAPRRQPARQRCRWAPKPTTARSRHGRMRSAPGWH